MWQVWEGSDGVGDSAQLCTSLHHCWWDWCWEPAWSLLHPHLHTLGKSINTIPHTIHTHTHWSCSQPYVLFCLILAEWFHTRGLQPHDSTIAVCHVQDQDQPSSSCCHQTPAWGCCLPLPHWVWCSGQLISMLLSHPHFSVYPWITSENVGIPVPIKLCHTQGWGINKND